MPPLPPAPLCLRLKMTGFIGTQPWMFRTFWQYSGTVPNATTLASLAHSMVTASYGKLNGSSGNNVSWGGGELLDISSSSGASAVDGTNAIGQRSTPADTALEAIHCKFQIPRRYRGGHPGVYLPPAGSSDKASVTLWNSAVIATLFSDFASWIGACSALTVSGTSIVNMVNISYYQGFTVVTDTHGRAHNVPKLRSVPQIDVVQAVVPQNLISTQRRRGNR